MPGSEAPRDVIFAFAYASWKTAVDRGMCFSEDRLAQALLEDPRVRRLMVVETPAQPADQAGQGPAAPPAPFPATERASLYSPLRARRMDPRGVRALEHTSAGGTGALRAAAQRRGLERPALITTHPLAPGFAALEWVDSLTYYVYDDWASAPRFRRWWPAYEEVYRRVRERGHRVVAVSDAIIRRIAPSGPHAVVPNGVDPAEWQAPRPAPSCSRPAGPRLLYVGSLDARIDVDQLQRAARAYPASSFVVTGPVLDEGHFARCAPSPTSTCTGPSPAARSSGW